MPIKKTIIVATSILVLLGMAVAMESFSQVIRDYDELLNDLVYSQSLYYLANDTYFSKDVSALNDMVYQVWEYVDHTGTRGYWIKTETLNTIESVGYGPDADLRTWSILKIWETATSSEKSL